MTLHIGSKMVRTETVWKMKVPSWEESFTLYVLQYWTGPLTHQRDLENPTDDLKVVIFEDKKKGVQRKLGEVVVLPFAQKQNEQVDLTLPIEGEKGRTIGELKLALRYKVLYYKGPSLARLPARNDSNTTPENSSIII